MRRLISTAMLSTISVPMAAFAAETFPRSAELVAAQEELDAVRATGSRNQMDAEMQRRLDVAIKTRDAELDKRNAEWGKRDGASMLKAQADTCSNVRQWVGEGKKVSDWFDKLRYAGFSSDEALDIVLQINRGTAKVGNTVAVAFCILGLPDDTMRTEMKNSRTVMFVYPNMFVHAEDGVITAWSDR